jgi:hypothetical protein
MKSRSTTALIDASFVFPISRFSISSVAAFVFRGDLATVSTYLSISIATVASFGTGANPDAEM